MEDLYNENNAEFKKRNDIEDVEEEDEKESEEEDEVDNNQINIYNKNDFELDKVLKFFFNNNIISKV